MDDFKSIAIVEDQFGPNSVFSGILGAETLEHKATGESWLSMEIPGAPCLSNMPPCSIHAIESETYSWHGFQ
jgi:hypothetical protein